MLIVGLVLVGIAAAIHVFIFYLESIAWTSARARATFGIASEEEARATRALAFNQGFYNLFLAVAVLLGIILIIAGMTAAGVTAVLIGAGSMVAAGLVLLLSSPDKASAALKQGVIPLLGIVAVIIGTAV